MKKGFNFLIILIILTLMISLIGCGNQIYGPEVNKDIAPAVGLPDFKTVDIYGNEVTNEIFKENKLTMVNVWGTNCRPCIGEMPGLGEIHKEYQGKGVNIVGFVVDVQDSELNVIDNQIKLAQDIAETTGADFTHMTVTQELIDAKIGEIDAIPATFFIDSQGRFVGETYIGSRDKEEWVDLIEKTLGEM